MITRIDVENDIIDDIGDVSAQTFEFTDRRAKKDATYIYEIRAYNQAWRMSYPVSIEITK